MSNSLLSLSNQLADAVEKAGASVIAVNARRATPSSGVIWRPGVIATSDHTTERDEEITVTFGDGRSAPATLAGRDATTDLAVLRLADTSGTVADVAGDAELRAGNIVLAVGRGPTASLGVVSSVGGAFRSWRGGAIDKYLRLDVSIYHGFSGGALIDAEGRVLGINTSGIARGMPMTVPAVTVNRVVEELLKRGHIGRGYLGVGLQPVRLPSGQGGLIVLSVETDGPAEKAGLLVGDILTGVDGKPMADPVDLQAQLDPSQVGRTVLAQIIRGGAKAEIPIKVGERPRGA
ncbi:MAG: S1C family serine protease [Bryobacteraceae bacterium]